jgi:predicted RNA-binding Zn ribbon-like protein
MMVTEHGSGLTAGPPRIGPAPGDLEIVQRFVNTLDIESGTDELDSPAGLSNWLAGSGLVTPPPGGPVRPGDVAVSPALRSRAVALREALRGVLSSHVPAPGGPDRARARAAAAGLRKVAGTLRVRIEVGDDGRVAPGPADAGPAAALTRILLIVAQADAAGTWSRLKACSASDCRWVFYDRSPTRSGCWCSMRVCGSRAKSRAYRRRTAAGTGDPARGPELRGIGHRIGAPGPLRIGT